MSVACLVYVNMVLVKSENLNLYENIKICAFILKFFGNLWSILEALIFFGFCSWSIILEIIHIWRPDWGWGRGIRQKQDDIGCRGWGVANVQDAQSLFFLLKKIGFAPWPDIILSQRLIYYWQEIFLLTLVSDRKSHPLIIPLHCLWAKWNNRTCG